MIGAMQFGKGLSGWAFGGLLGLAACGGGHEARPAVVASAPEPGAPNPAAGAPAPAPTPAEVAAGSGGEEAHAAAAAPAAAPDGAELLAGIECAVDHFEFGRVWQGAQVAHEFEFQAAGEHPLTIVDFRPDCGCTVAHLEILKDDGTRATYELKTPVPPGTRFALAVTFDTTNREGHQQKSVKIYANLPEGVRAMTLAADIQPLVRIDPRSQSIERMSVLEARETEFRVHSEGGERFGLSLSRAGLPEALEVRLTPLEPDAEGRASAWDVHVTLSPGMPKGIHSYSIELPTDVSIPGAAAAADGTPLPLKVSALVAAVIVGRVAVQPQNLAFGMVAENETTARTVRLSSFDPGFVLPEPKVRVEPQKPGQPHPLASTVRTTTRRVEGSGDWEIELLLEGLGPEVARSFAGRLVIETGHPEEPLLEVPFSGLRRGR
jgi:hypothetical protein